MLYFLSAGFAGLCSAAPAIAQGGLETVTIGFPSRSMTELPNQIAAAVEFYRQEGIDVRLIQARSNILVAALASGSMDYITSVNSSLSGIMSGVPATPTLRHIGLDQNEPRLPPVLFLHFLITAMQD